MLLVDFGVCLLKCNTRGDPQNRPLLSTFRLILAVVLSVSLTYQMLLVRGLP